MSESQIVCYKITFEGGGIKLKYSNMILPFGFQND